MKLRRPFIISLAVLLLGGLGAFCLWKPKPLTYQGRATEEWVLLLYGSDEPASNSITAIGSAAVPVIRDMLRSRERFYRSGLVAVSGQLSPGARRKVGRWAGPPQANTRRVCAARAAAILGTNAASLVGDLGVVLQGADAVAAWESGAALSRMGAGGAAQLVSAAGNGNPETRITAAHWLGQTPSSGKEETVALLKLRGDPDPRVQTMAAAALKQRAFGKSPEILPLLLSASDPAVADTAVAMLKMEPGRMRLAIPLLCDTARTGIPPVQLAALEVMGSLEVGDPRILGTLKGLSERESEPVKGAASKWLDRLQALGHKQISAKTTK